MKIKVNVLATIATLLFMLFAQTVSAQFVFEKTTKADVEYQQKVADKLAKKVMKKWRKANSDLPKNLREKIYNSAEVYNIPRYIGFPMEANTNVIECFLAKDAVGYVECVYDGVSLGCAFVNEAGGTQYITYNTVYNGQGSILPDVQEKSRQIIRQNITDNKTFVCAGVNLSGKMVAEKDETYRVLSLATAEELTYESSTTDENDYYVDMGSTHRGAAVLFMCLGFILTVCVFGLIVAA